jgi:hypothetical protein
VYSFCVDSFYLSDTSIRDTKLFQASLKHCLECLSNAESPANSTISSLGVNQQYWRNSIKISKLYKFYIGGICVCSSPQHGIKERGTEQTKEEDDTFDDNGIHNWSLL